MKINYRPEIDGLRTISVLVVIFNHIGWKLFNGGYIGVDVFFVISGFLITLILTKEIQEKEFSIAKFYKRRIIRLAPAYFTVIIAATIIAVSLLLPIELIKYFSSTLYSTFFSANIYMWKNVGGYFNNQAESMPLLHLWSLAVEEQFYIFWPLFLWLLNNIISKKYRILTLLVGLLFCLAVSEWGVRKNPDMAYFLMPTRAFELALGALLAFAPRQLLISPASKYLPTVGLLLIVSTALGYSSETPFPGLYALPPCVGAALIILYANRDAEWVGKLLSSVPFNIGGKISYPAYLWHWPLIVALKIQLIDITFSIALAVIFLTFSLAYLTTRFIENPCKKLISWKFKKVFFIAYLAPTTIFIVLTYLANHYHGWPSRFSESVLVKSVALESHSNLIRKNCYDGDPAHPGSAEQCILGINKPSVDILLIGDSHANHYSGFIDVLANNANLRGYDITQSDTIYLPDTHRFHQQKGRRVEHQKFYERNAYISNILKTQKFRFVVLSASFAKHFDTGDWELDTHKTLTANEIFKLQFEEVLRQIQAADARPVIIRSTPNIGADRVRCPLENALGRSRNDCARPAKEYVENYRNWNSYLDELVKIHPEIIVIDPASIICTDSRCAAELDGIPLYKDSGHLNYQGSQILANKYIKKFGNPFILNGQTEKRRGN